MSEAFEDVHANLRGVMLGALTGAQVVSVDRPGDFVVRTRQLDAKTGEPGWFGMVAIKKSYVSYHLMPLYERPELVSRISGELGLRRQGKTCFNFKRVDLGLFEELGALTTRAAEG